MEAFALGCIGTWIAADGIASLWTYWPNKGETFWRNHALRIWRVLLGLVTIGIGVMLI